MLTFAEEIYLLALDDITGRILVSSKKIVLESVLVGAVLAELAFKGRIDSDTSNIYISSTDPTGDVLLDVVLEKFAQAKSDTFTIDHVIRVVLHDAEKYEQLVLSQLVEKGVLKRVEEKVLWIFPSRRYPVIDNHEITDVETRLRRILLSDEIPDPADAALISLVDACDLFHEILSPREYKRCEQRIAELSKLDLVTSKVKQLIFQIQEIACLTPYV